MPFPFSFIVSFVSINYVLFFKKEHVTYEKRFTRVFAKKLIPEQYAKTGTEFPLFCIS
jgi:hypothetical protein